MTSSPTPQGSEPRSRPHPTERFAAPEHRFDLREVADFLRREGSKASSGHRQVAVYKRGPTTLILFVFEEGGLLKDHSTGGIATIQCIDGALEVETENGTHEIGPRQLVVLDSHVRHSVRAKRASEMLLSVHLDPEHTGESHPGPQ
jgi:quercetin dioxygenase-like cupin family protein